MRIRDPGTEMEKIRIRHPGLSRIRNTGETTVPHALYPIRLN